MAIVSCPTCGTKNRVDERRRDVQPVCGQCGTKLPVSANDRSPVNVTDATFARDVLGSPVPTLVDCWAPWCGPCRTIGPIIDQLAAESNGRYRVAKLNVDENPGTSRQYRIEGIPALLIFKAGKLVDQLVGAHPKQTIVQHLGAQL